jgi:hypothetical protein
VVGKVTDRLDHAVGELGDASKTGRAASRSNKGSPKPP